MRPAVYYALKGKEVGARERDVGIATHGEEAGIWRQQA
jgi:hypothetical protein